MFRSISQPPFLDFGQTPSPVSRDTTAAKHFFSGGVSRGQIFRGKASGEDDFLPRGRPARRIFWEGLPANGFFGKGLAARGSFRQEPLARRIFRKGSGERDFFSTDLWREGFLGKGL